MRQQTQLKPGCAILWNLPNCTAQLTSATGKGAPTDYMLRLRFAAVWLTTLRHIRGFYAIHGLEHQALSLQVTARDSARVADPQPSGVCRLHWVTQCQRNVST